MAKTALLTSMLLMTNHAPLLVTSAAPSEAGRLKALSTNDQKTTKLPHTPTSVRQIPQTSSTLNLNSQPLALKIFGSPGGAQSTGRLLEIVKQRQLVYRFDPPRDERPMTAFSKICDVSTDNAPTATAAELKNSAGRLNRCIYAR